MNLDVLIFAAHPDDAELSMGGTIARFTSSGIKTGIIDLTEAELSTRGTIESRRMETENASAILNIDLRENLGFPDGELKPLKEFINPVVAKIRQYKPKIIFAPHFHDRHPDHTGAAQIVKEAFFFSGLARYETIHNEKLQQAYRPSKLFYFYQTYDNDPSFVTDISQFYETKMKAVKAYSTQFYNPESKEPETFISKESFILYLEARAKYFGFKIGRNYGEPFFCEEKIEYDFKNLLD
jgi:bacillithiol biosynthesis deacetylase BshB1